MIRLEIPWREPDPWRWITSIVVIGLVAGLVVLAPARWESGSAALSTRPLRRRGSDQ